MGAIINVVTSVKCPACKMCGTLIDRIKDYYPDVRVLYWDGDDPSVQKFQRNNLYKLVSDIKDAELRGHYESQGIRVLSGLPTMYITSDNRPTRILDISVGCVSPNAEYQQKQSMKRDLQMMFSKARAYDYGLNNSSAVKFMEKRGG